MTAHAVKPATGNNRIKAKHATAAVLASVVAAALGGIAFAGWIDNGADIFMTMAQTGLSWCF
ncbi:MAG: hypothetical protein AB3N20_03505 [Rhizobiaceae bacterium]